MLKPRSRLLRATLSCRLALSYGLKEVYRKDFDEVFAEEQTKPESVKLAERMGVTTNGHLNMDAEQWSACCKLEFAFR